MWLRGLRFGLILLPVLFAGCDMFTVRENGVVYTLEHVEAFKRALEARPTTLTPILADKLNRNEDG